jgi:indole-3-acetate monooxygenase
MARGNDTTTLAADSVTTREWLECATGLAAVIEAHRDESEQQRHMARPIFDELARTGIFEMLVPSAFGGPQAHPSANTRVIEEISRLDGSAGWNAMIWSGSGFFADYLPEDVADEILHVGQGTVVCGAVKPTGQARPLPGGFEVMGRWSFASGCNYATWFMAGCVVMAWGPAAHTRERHA